MWLNGKQSRAFIPFLHPFVEIGYFWWLMLLKSLHARSSGWTRMGSQGGPCVSSGASGLVGYSFSIAIGLTLYTWHRFCPLAEMEWNESSGRVRLEPRMWRAMEGRLKNLPLRLCVPSFRAPVPEFRIPTRPTYPGPCGFLLNFYPFCSSPTLKALFPLLFSPKCK